jgi:hypothetical protein
MSHRDKIQAALVTALRRFEAVIEDASPLAAAAALEAASGAANLLSSYDGDSPRHAARDELLRIMQRAATLMHSLSAPVPSR